MAIQESNTMATTMSQMAGQEFAPGSRSLLDGLGGKMAPAPITNGSSVHTRTPAATTAKVEHQNHLQWTVLRYTRIGSMTGRIGFSRSQQRVLSDEVLF